jgi:hypothetical protein
MMTEEGVEVDQSRSGDHEGDECNEGLLKLRRRFTSLWLNARLRGSLCLALFSKTSTSSGGINMRLKNMQMRNTTDIPRSGIQYPKQ